MNSYSDKQQQVDSNRQDIPSTKKNKMSQPSFEFIDKRPDACKQMKLIESIKPPHTPVIPHSQSPAIQRMIGMEIELNIPFYQENENYTTQNIFPVLNSNKRDILTENDRKEISSFLWGGCEYGTVYGKSDNFDISADHGGFSVAHKNFLEEITGTLVHNTGNRKSMTNMEYRTIPFEERKPSDQEKFNMTVTQIQDHANKSVIKATSDQQSNLDLPAERMYTGIPKEALTHLTKNYPRAQTLLQALIQSNVPYAYYQTTTGLLPSEIPGFFDEAIKDFNKESDSEGQDTQTDRITIIAKTHLKKSIWIADNTMAEEKWLNSLFSEAELKSIKGWLTLVAEYMLGYDLEITSLRFDPKTQTRRTSTEKNILPYLSKTPMGETLQALPPRVREHIYANMAIWEQLFKDMARIKNKANIFNAIGERDTRIGHGEMFGRNTTPLSWIKTLLHKYAKSNINLENISTELETRKDSIDNSQTAGMKDNLLLKQIYTNTEELVDRAITTNGIILQKLGVPPGLPSLRGWLSLISLGIFTNRFKKNYSALSSYKVVSQNFITELNKISSSYSDIGPTINQIPFRYRPNFKREIDGKPVWKEFMKQFHSLSTESKFSCILPIESSHFIPQEWDTIEQLVDYVNTEMVLIDNMLDLDEETSEELEPRLSFNEEQAIPLEDRRTANKISYQGASDIHNLTNILTKEWERAFKRRESSTYSRTRLTQEYNSKLPYIKTWFTEYVPTSNEVKAILQNLMQVDINATDAESEYKRFKDYVTKLDNYIQYCKPDILNELRMFFLRIHPPENRPPHFETFNTLFFSRLESEQEVSLFLELRDFLSEHKKIAEAEALHELDLRRRQAEIEKKAQISRRGGITPSTVIKSSNPVITKPKLPQTGLPSIRKP